MSAVQKNFLDFRRFVVFKESVSGEALSVESVPFEGSDGEGPDVEEPDVEMVITVVVDVPGYQDQGSSIRVLAQGRVVPRNEELPKSGGTLGGS